MTKRSPVRSSIRVLDRGALRAACGGAIAPLVPIENTALGDGTTSRREAK
jgi:hypothetical protein